MNKAVENDTGIEVIRFNEPAPYLDVYEDQRRRRAAVESGTAPEALFLLEHTPTITLGRNAHENHLLQSRDALRTLGVEVVDVDRGGDVTYHGPGQLVAYPILNLERRQLSITTYIRKLEQVVIEFLHHFDLRGERMEKFTGVWVGGAKVAAIGIGVHRQITFHGTAINIDPNMAHWQLIVPCGIADKPLATFRQLMDREPPSMTECFAAFETAFLHTFGPKA